MKRRTKTRTLTMGTKRTKLLHSKEALKALQKVQYKSLKQNQVALIDMLKGYAKLASLDDIRHICALICRDGEKSVVMGNDLVIMYMKCGRLEDARKVFDELPKRDLLSWTVMISGYVKYCFPMEALKLFWQMEGEEVKPSEVIFVAVVNACASIAALEQGKQVHVHIMKQRYQVGIFLESALVDMYAKCGSLKDSRMAFDGMLERDVVTWTAMITGYAQCRLGEEALQIYYQMQSEGVEPNEITLNSVLNACASVGNLDLAREIHSQILTCGIKPSLTMGNAIVDMYAKCGNMDDACQAFENMPNRNIISWTSIISGYTRCGHAEIALKLFQEMERGGIKPNMITFLTVLNACAQSGNLEFGKKVHIYLSETEIQPNIYLSNTVVDMYAKCGSLENAYRVFNKMSYRNVVSWTAIIAAYVEHGHHEEAFDLFSKMHQEAERPNEITFISLLNACTCLGDSERGKWIHDILIRRGFGQNVFLGYSLVNMYAKCGSLKEARQVFDEMPEQNLVAWNGMISGYAQHGHPEKAFTLFRNMEQECMEADEVTLVTILNAAASLPSLTLGRQIHARSIKSIFEANLYVGSALIDMYAKCGSIEDARQVFERSLCRNVVLWTAMIAAYARHGFSKEVLQLIEQMQQEGVKLNHITYIQVLLACSHSGLVDEGHQYFDSMISDYGVLPIAEHYACVVDLLGRCGRLQEAEEFIKALPLEPGAVVWLSFLAACRIHSNVELAKLATENIALSEPEKGSGFVLLSNIYAAAGIWDDKG